MVFSELAKHWRWHALPALGLAVTDAAKQLGVTRAGAWLLDAPQKELL